MRHNALRWVFAVVLLTGPSYALIPQEGGPAVLATPADAFGADASDAGSVPDEPACIPRDECCRVCDRGKACGNSCIKATYNCHKGRGCSCNESEVCE
jgi:hypothetical protein